MVAPPEMRYPRRANDGVLAARILDSGCAFMLLGALVLTWRRRAGCNAEHVLAGFALWMLGVGLATLSLIAGQFPGLAVAAAAALATALRGYLLGGLWTFQATKLQSRRHEPDGVAL